MPPESTVRRWASQYTVTAAVGGDPIDDSLFEITVEQTCRTDEVELWAIRRRRLCLDRHGKWSHEPISYERSDEWLDAHRFDLDTALKLAEQAAPKVTVNGWLPDGTRASG